MALDYSRPDGISSEIKRYIGEYRKIGTMVRIPNHILDRAEVNERVDYITRELLVSIETYIESMRHYSETVKRGPRTVLSKRLVPSNCWQHFKHDVFPGWLLNRFPVVYEEVDTWIEEEVHMKVETINVCPYLDAGASTKQKYFEFLVHGGWRG